MTQSQPRMNAAMRFFATFATVRRCHLVGSMLSLLLITISVWITQATWQDSSQLEMNGIVVDLNEASLLCDSADQWRSEYTVSYQEAKAIEERVGAIKQWLPARIEWRNVENNLRIALDESGLRASTIRKGVSHEGDRTGVVTASCEVEGDYVGLCRFLGQLSDQEIPVACSELRLQRSLRNPEFETNADEPECRATLTLRIPHAVKESYSGRLLLSEESNES